MNDSAERKTDLRSRMKDFCTDTIIGIDKKIEDFFIEQCFEQEKDVLLVQDKAYLLVAHTYTWFFGLRKRRLEEQMFRLKKIPEEVMEFLNNIWKCYGDFSIEELEKMQHEERKVCKESIPHHYYEVHLDMHDGTVIGKKMLNLYKTYTIPENCKTDDKHLYYFHSMENENISDYLPANVVLTINNDGLPEIVKLAPELCS